MQQVVTRLRNRGYIGDHPRCALRLSGDDYDDAGRSRDFWLYVQEKGSTFPENYSLTTSRQGLTFSKKRPIPAGSLMLYACDYCRTAGFVLPSTPQRSRRSGHSRTSPG